MKAVNDAVEESTNVVSALLKFAANLIAPEEDEGNTHCRESKANQSIDQWRK